MKDISTTFANNKLNDKDALDFIKKNIEPIKNMSFSVFFNEYLGNHQNVTTSEIVRRSGLSRTYAYEVINGTKKGSRDKIIALCLAAEMTEDELNHALMYSNNSVLYAKNSRDAYISYYFRNHISTDAINLCSFLEDNDAESLDI